VTYYAGQEIRQGDRVTYGGNAAVIELVVQRLTDDPEEDWLFENQGGPSFRCPSAITPEGIDADCAGISRSSTNDGTS